MAAVLESDRVLVEVIADGVHVHPAVLRLVFRTKGAKGVVLVTDAISAAAMPDGVYRVGNLEVTVEDGTCRVPDGRLAGSTLTMDRGLAFLSQWLGSGAGYSLPEIVATATVQPADLLGLSRKGRIEVGCDSDLVLLDSDFRVLKTWVQGSLVYDSARPA